MSSLELLLIPAALTIVGVILFFTAWIEDSVLSPRSLIAYTVRTRSRISPEDVERLVAAQSERLLGNLNRRR